MTIPIQRNKINHCGICQHTNKQVDEYPCNKCVHNALDHFKPMTNFDRIKNMSVEELAEFICGIYDMEEDNAKFINGTIIPGYNEQDIREWLERGVVN